MILNHALLAEGIYNIRFDWPVFFSQLFGFAVIVWFFAKYVVPPMKRIMNDAQNKIRRQLEESDAAADRLATAKAAYDNAVAEAQAELERMREEARIDADRIIAQMREVAATEVERVRKQGRDQILQYRRQMIRDLEVDLAAAMLALTEEKVREQLGSPQQRADSIDRFLEDLEALANSGEARREPQSERK
ncbi:hypothetical protein ACFXHA_11130 [Nocardia sp. NPDC059240]|uniref:F0F1 ATP synthase subunit B family protein n=1 Tax=Nocardia sp. NPDC059240 TaxID=3346786 RepID=UPI0036A66F66